MPEIVRFTKLNPKMKSRTDVISDTIANRTHVITTANVDGVLKRAAAHRQLRTPKQDGLFCNYEPGDDFECVKIAKIPRLTIVKARRGPFWCKDCREIHPGWLHPDGSENEAAFAQWLDAHPGYKTVDANWTRVKSRAMHRGGIKNAR